MNVTIEQIASREQLVRVVIKNTCNHCKEKYRWDNFAYLLSGNKFNNGQGLHDVGLCYSCKNWLDQFWADVHGRDYVVINGNHYTIGNRIEGVELKGSDTLLQVRNKLQSIRRGRGMGGEPQIIRTSSGELIITTDLWHQGKIPEAFANYPLFQNNAMFVEL